MIAIVEKEPCSSRVEKGTESGTPLERLLAAGDAGLLDPTVWYVRRPAVAMFVSAGATRVQAGTEDGAAFAAAWPVGAPGAYPAPGIFPSWRVYRAARGHVLDLLALLDRDDGGSWDVLYRRARMHGVPTHEIAALWPVRRAARQAGLAPSQMTRPWAAGVDRPLAGQDRAAFRRGLAILDGLTARPGLAASGIVPDAPIGRLPRYVGGVVHHELPPSLAEACEARSDAARRAVRLVYNLALAIGLCAEDEDVAPAILLAPAAWRRLETADPGLAGLSSPAAMRAYLDRTRRALGAPGLPDPRGETSWAELRRRARTLAPDLRLDALSHVSTRAEAAGLAPCTLDQAWAAQALATTADGLDRNALRSALGRLNALRAVADGALLALLPAHAFDLVALGGRRPKMVDPTGKKAVPAMPNPAERWARLFTEARYEGVEITTALCAVRGAAIARALGPEAVSRDAALSLLDEEEDVRRRAKLRRGLRDLDAMRHRTPLREAGLPAEPVGALPDRRRGANLALHDTLATALADHGRRWGLARNTMRAQRSAVASAWSAAVRLGLASAERPATLEQLLSPAMLDRVEEKLAPRTRRVLESLAADLRLPLTPAWARLQAAIAAAGVAPRDNPVRTLLAAPGCPDPRRIDDAWVRRHLSALRPDQRRTFKRTLDRFEALYSVPGVVATGLLPARRLSPRAPGTRIRVMPA